MITALIRRLNEPFPDRKSLKQSVIRLICIGAFVALFLYTVRPFQLYSSVSYSLPSCLGYGLVTIIFGGLYEFFVRHVLKVQTDIPSWTLWKWILLCGGLILWISLGNFLFLNMTLGWEAVDFRVLAIILRNTLIVGGFPVVFIGLMIQMRAARVNEREASDIQPGLSGSVPPADNSTLLFPLNAEQTLALTSASVLYIEAMQNYVSICYMEQGEVCRQLLRHTITKIQSEFEGSSVVRCHRSYMVNIDSIDSVRGNAQGLKVRLNELAQPEIPVSRTYIPTLKALL